MVNGDLVDRGPDSPGCVDLIRGLAATAPDGHVRYLAGNHELYVPYPAKPDWDRWYTGGVTDGTRRRFCDRVLAGEMTVAFEGYEYAYVHAGAPEGVDAAALNDAFRAAVRAFRDRVGAGGLGSVPVDEERTAFERAFGEHCPTLYPRSDEDVPIREDPNAGVVWLDFDHLPADAPPQVVGHTPHETVTRTGTVVCQDVILRNADSPGGECVLVETRDDLRALVREPDGSVSVRSV